MTILSNTCLLIIPETNTRIEIFYRVENTKIRFISLIFQHVQNQITFNLANVWINGQPAKNLKGFKAQILQESSLSAAQEAQGQLHLFSHAFQAVEIPIFYAGCEYQFKVSPNLKVKGLHQLIADKILCSNFKIYDKCSLAPLPESATLADCNITKSTQLVVYNRKNKTDLIHQENAGKTHLECSMGLSSLLFVNFKDPVNISFNPQAPCWRTIDRGLNVEGKCVNNQCEANNHFVCVAYGLGEFHMHEIGAKICCVLCNQKLEPSSANNCIFWDCIYTIEGVQENFALFNDTKHAPKDQAVSFAEISSDLKSQFINWKYLKIKTQATSLVGSYCTLL